MIKAVLTKAVGRSGDKKLLSHFLTNYLLEHM
jgi:hypothetical protein